MNLLTEKWIPVLKEEKNYLISPAEISNNEILSLNAARADFQGALAQFLIGLLQTIYFDLTSKEWEKLYRSPPSENQLKEKFKILNDPFKFDGYHSRFMQDMDLSKKEKSIASLLIDQPGEKTIEDNTDFFVRRNSINKMCYSCGATALFTLQINAPSGGVGHRTSVRGGGPLTTLLIDESEENNTLWKTLWLNVMSSNDFEKYVGSSLNFPQDQSLIFPWLSEINEKKSESLTPKDAHPLQVFWSMPRRIKINFENTISGECDICGCFSEDLIQYYLTKNYGINYTGKWIHPLSPYRHEKKDESLIPLHPQPGGITYNYFQSIFFDNCAAIIAAQRNSNTDFIDLSSIKIWSFGYDMDNMKSRCWYESKMPFYQIKNENILNIFNKNYVGPFIESAKYLFRSLGFYLGKTNSPLESAKKTFWELTENKFYELISEILVNLEKENCDLNEHYSNEHYSIEEDWLVFITNETLRIFDQYCKLAHYEKKRQLHAIFSARKNLKDIIFSKKVYTMLNLKKEQ